jgi:hypothetical protein
MDDDECETVGRMIGRINGSTWRKSALVPFCPPQIPYDVNRAGTRAALGSNESLKGVHAATDRPQARKNSAAAHEIEYDGLFLKKLIMTKLHFVITIKLMTQNKL